MLTSLGNNPSILASAEEEECVTSKGPLLSKHVMCVYTYALKHHSTFNNSSRAWRVTNKGNSLAEAWSGFTCNACSLMAAGAQMIPPFFVPLGAYITCHCMRVCKRELYQFRHP